MRKQTAYLPGLTGDLGNDDAVAEISFQYALDAVHYSSGRKALMHSRAEKDEVLREQVNIRFLVNPDERHIVSLVPSALAICPATFSVFPVTEEYKTKLLMYAISPCLIP